MESKTWLNMEYLKYILYSFIVLAFSSCEYNLLRFGWTDYPVDQRFEDSRRYNEKHPAQNLSIDTDEYTFTATSDYHLHTDSVFLPKFFDYINGSQSTFVALNGDLYNSKEEFADFAYSALTKGIKIPAYYTCGNHDEYFGWHLYYDRFGSSTYSFTVTTPNYQDLYIALETGSSTLGRGQYEWLLEVLSKRDEYRYCIIITHSNITYQGFLNGTFTQEETVVLFDLFAKNNVNMVISGHSHRENDLTIESVRYVTNGAIKSGEFGTCFVKNAGVDFKFEDLE